MSQLRLQGFDTLVLQWTRTAMHSPSQNSARYCLSVPQRATGWPEADCRAERRSGIFYHQKQSSAALESYLNRLLAADSSKPDYGAPCLA